MPSNLRSAGLPGTQPLEVTGWHLPGFLAQEFTVNKEKRGLNRRSRAWEAGLALGPTEPSLGPPEPLQAQPPRLFVPLAVPGLACSRVEH